MGTSQTPVFLTADIRTLGLAASRAILLHPELDIPPVTVAHSVDATGDIARTSIGFAKGVSGMRLSILTHINLIDSGVGLDQQVSGTSAVYLLEGQQSGRQPYSDPLIVVSADKRQISIHQTINLIP